MLFSRVTITQKDRSVHQMTDTQLWSIRGHLTLWNWNFGTGINLSILCTVIFCNSIYSRVIFLQNIIYVPSVAKRKVSYFVFTITNFLNSFFSFFVFNIFAKVVLPLAWSCHPILSIADETFCKSKGRFGSEREPSLRYFLVHFINRHKMLCKCILLDN